MKRSSVIQIVRRVLRSAWLMVLFALLQGGSIVQAGAPDNNTSLDQLAFRMQNPSWNAASGIAGTTPALVVDQPVAESRISAWFQSGKDKFKSVCSSAATAIGNTTIKVFDGARDMFGSAKAKAADIADTVGRATIQVGAMYVGMIKDSLITTGQATVQVGAMVKDGLITTGQTALNLLLEAGKGLDFFVQAGLPAGIRALKGEDVLFQGSNPDACEDVELNDLANSAYNEDGHANNTNWTRVPSPIVDGMNKDGAWWDLSGGFHAELYENKITGQHVLAFRGTEKKSWRDWADDILNAAFGLSSQYVEAADLAAALKINYKDLILTGHSLGGGLAQYAAASQNLRAVTFNAASPSTFNLLGVAIAGVSDSESSKTINYRHISDPISTIDEVTDFSTTKTIGHDRILDGSEIGFDAHELEPLRNVLNQQCSQNTLLPTTGSTQTSAGQATGTTGTGTGNTTLLPSDSPSTGSQGSGTPNNPDSSIGTPGNKTPNGGKRINEQYGQ